MLYRVPTRWQPSRFKHCATYTTLSIAQAVFDANGCVVDPHTAVGICTATRSAATSPACPTVCMSSAHAAKFIETVSKALGYDAAATVELLRAKAAGHAHIGRVLDMVGVSVPCRVLGRSDDWEGELRRHIEQLHSCLDG